MASLNDKYRGGNAFYFTDADGGHHTTDLNGRSGMQGMTEVQPRRFEDAEGNVYRVPEWDVGEFMKNNVREGRKVLPQYRMRQGGGNIGDAITGHVGQADEWVSDYSVHAQELRDRGWQRVDDAGDPTLSETAFQLKTYADWYSDPENAKRAPKNAAKGGLAAIGAGAVGVARTISDLLLSGGAFVSDALGASGVASEARATKREADAKFGSMIDGITEWLGQDFYNEGDGTREMVRGALCAAETMGGLYGLGKSVGFAGKGVQAFATSLGKTVGATTAATGAMAALSGAEGYEDTIGAAEAQGREIGWREHTAGAINGAVAAAIAPLYGKMSGIIGREESMRLIMRNYGKMLALAGADMAEGAALSGAQALAGEAASAVMGDETPTEDRAKRVLTSALTGGLVVAGTKVPGALGGWFKQNRAGYARAAQYQGRIALETVGSGMPLVKSRTMCPDVKATTVNGEVVFNDGSVYAPGRGEVKVPLGNGHERTIPAEPARIKLADGRVIDLEGNVVSVTAGELKTGKLTSEARTPQEVVERASNPESTRQYRIIDPETGMVAEVGEIAKLQAPESVKQRYEAERRGDAAKPELDAEGWAYMSLYQQVRSPQREVSEAAQIALERVAAGEMTYREAASLVDDAVAATMGRQPSIYGLSEIRARANAQKSGTGETATETSAQGVSAALPQIGVSPGPERAGGALPSLTVERAKELAGLVADGTVAKTPVDVTRLPTAPRTERDRQTAYLAATLARPTVVLERNDGTMAVVGDDGKVADAKAVGAKTVDAVVVKEEDGWNEENAQAIAIVTALKDGQMTYAEAIRGIAKLGLDTQDLKDIGADTGLFGEGMLAQAVKQSANLGSAAMEKVDDGNVSAVVALGETCNAATAGVGWEEAQGKLVEAMPEGADADQAYLAGTIISNAPELEGERAWEIATWCAAAPERADINGLLNAGPNGVAQIEKLMAADGDGTVCAEMPDGSFKTINQVEAEAGAIPLGNTPAPTADRRFELTAVEGKDGAFHCARFPEVTRTVASDGEGNRYIVIDGLTPQTMLERRNRSDMGAFLDGVVRDAERLGMRIDLKDARLCNIAEELIANYHEEGREAAMERRQKAVVNVLTKSGLGDVVLDGETFAQTLAQYPGAEAWAKDGETYGFYLNGKVYLNKDYFGTKIGLNTAIHEFAHPAVIACRKANPDLYRRGMDLIAATDFYREVSENGDYAGQSETSRREEALVRLVSSRLEDIKAKVPAKIYKEIEAFVNAFWQRFGEAQGIRDLTPAAVATMTVEDIADAIGAEMASGKPFGAEKLDLAQSDLKAKLDRFAHYRNQTSEAAKAAWKAICEGWRVLTPEQKAGMETWADPETHAHPALATRARLFDRLREWDEKRAKMSAMAKKQARTNPSPAMMEKIRSSREFYVTEGGGNPHSPFAFVMTEQKITIPKPGEEGYEWWKRLTDGMKYDQRRNLTRLLSGKTSKQKSVGNDAIPELWFAFVNGRMPTAEEKARLPNFEDFMAQVMEEEEKYQQWKRDGMLTVDEQMAKRDKEREDAEADEWMRQEEAWVRESEANRVERERMGEQDAGDMPNFSRPGLYTGSAADYKWGDGEPRYSVRSALGELAEGNPKAVIHNAEYGDIEYWMGRFGKRGFGLAHIVESRMEKDGDTLDVAVEVAIKVAEAAAAGTVTKERYNTKHFDLDGVRAIVAFNDDGNKVITGYEISADASGGANRRPPSTRPEPHVSLEEIVSALKSKLALMPTPNSIANPGADVNAPDIRLSRPLGVVGRARVADDAGGTPNGRPTRLDERQQMQVSTPAFKAWFGDWEKKANVDRAVDFALHGTPVSTISGNEFEQSGNHDLIDRVAAFYEEIGGSVDNEELGTIILDRDSVKSSLGHGIGRSKASAFAAVPDVLRKGIVFDRQTNWKDRGTDTFVLCAPIVIGKDTYVCEAIVEQRVKGNERRFYLHEVNLQSSLAETIKTPTGGADNGKPSRPVRSIIAKLVAEIQRDSVSKVVDENGYPLVVYHGDEDPSFTAFDPAKVQRGNGFWFSDRDTASSYAKDGEPRAFFLRAKRIASEGDMRGALLDDYHANGGAGASWRAFVWDRAAADFLRKRGYDGLAFDGNIIVFDPAQIKSATDNTGAFDPANPDIRLSRPLGGGSLFVAGRARVADDAGVGEWTPGAIAASAELSGQGSNPISAAGSIRHLSLPLSEMEWLRKKLTGNVIPAHVAKRIPGGAASAHNLGGKLVIAADVFGSVDKTDMAKEKQRLAAHGFFRNEDPTWCASQMPADIRAERTRSENQLAQQLLLIGERRANGTEPGGESAARGIFADELAQIVMNLPSGAPGTVGRVQKIGHALARRLANGDMAAADAFLDWAAGAAPSEPRTDKERIAGMFGAFLVMPRRVDADAPGWYAAIVDTIATDPALAGAFRDLTVRGISEQSSAHVAAEIARSQSRETERAIAALKAEGEEPIRTASQKKEDLIIGFHDRMGAVAVRIDDRVRAYVRAKKEAMKLAKTPADKAALAAEIDRFTGGIETLKHRLELSRTAYERGANNEGMRYKIRMLLNENEATFRWAITEEDKATYLDAMRVIETQGRASSFGQSPRQAKITLERMEQRLGPTKWQHLQQYAHKFHAIHEQEVINDPRFERTFGKDFADYCRTQTDYVATKRTWSPEELDRIELMRARARQLGVNGGDDVISQMFTYCGRRYGSINDGAFTAQLKGSMAAKQEVRGATFEKVDRLMQFVRRNTYILDMRDALLAAGVEGVRDMKRGDVNVPDNNRYGHLDYLENGERRTLVVPKQIADGFKRDWDLNRLKFLKTVHEVTRKCYIDWAPHYWFNNIGRNNASMEKNMPGMHETWLKTLVRPIAPGAAAASDLVMHHVVRHLSERASYPIRMLFGKDVPLFYVPKATRWAKLFSDPTAWQMKLFEAEKNNDLGTVQEMTEDLAGVMEMLKGNMFVTLGRAYRNGKTEGFANDYFGKDGYRTLAKIAEDAAQRAASKKVNLLKIFYPFQRLAEQQNYEDVLAKTIAYLHDRERYAMQRSPQESGLTVKQNVSIPEGERAGFAKPFIQGLVNQFWNVFEKGNVRFYRNAKERPAETLGKCSRVWMGRIIGGLMTGGVLSYWLLKMFGGDEKKLRESKYAGVYDYLKAQERGWQNASKYVRKNTDAMTLWTSPEGYTSIMLTRPLTDEDKVIVPLADLTVRAIQKQMGMPVNLDVENALVDSTLKAVAPDLQMATPAVTLFRDTIEALYRNPDDFFTGAPKYDPDLWELRNESIEMSGEFGLAMAKQVWNDMGGRSFWPVARNGVDNRQNNAPGSVALAVDKIPFVSPVLRSFIKIQVGSPERDVAQTTEAYERMQKITRVLAKQLFVESRKAGGALNQKDPTRYVQHLKEWKDKYKLNDWEINQIEAKFLNAWLQWENPDWHKNKTFVEATRKQYKLGVEDPDLWITIGNP